MATYSFNQGSVQTAFPSYINYDFSVIDPPPVLLPPSYLVSGIVQLNWPIAFQTSQNVVASFINVTGVNVTTPAGFILPDSTQVSVGTAFVIQNISNVNIQIYLNDGTTLFKTIAAGAVYQFVLNDNSTSDGDYYWFQSGAAVSQQDADALAGMGLIASDNAKLNTNFPVLVLDPSVAPVYDITESSRAQLLVWPADAPAITFNLPSLGDTWGDGFYFAINNLSTASITLNPVADAGTTSQVLHGQTFYISIDEFGDWYTVGKGNDLFFNYTSNSQNISSPGPFPVTVDLTEGLEGNSMIRLVGTLLGDTIFRFPATPFVWYVNNQTTGDFTVTLSCEVPSTNTYLIPQGQQLIVEFDDAEFYSVPSTLPSQQKIIFANGSAANPSITFASDQHTGAYLRGQNMAITQNSNEVVDFESDAGVSVFNVPTSYRLRLLTPNTSIDVNTAEIGGTQTTTLKTTDGAISFLWNTNSATLFTDTTLVSEPVTFAAYDDTQTNLANLAFQSSGTSFYSLSFQVGKSTSLCTSNFWGNVTINGNETVTGNLTVNGTITGGGLPTYPLSFVNGGTSQASQPAAIKALINFTSQGQMIYASDGTGTVGYVTPTAVAGRTMVTTRNSTAQAPSWVGKSLLQVQTGGTFSTTESFSSGTVLTGSTLTITPTYQNSNIYLTFTCVDFSASDNTTYPSVNLEVTTNGGGSWTSILTPAFFGRFVGATSPACCSFNFIYSPNITSVVQFRLVLSNSAGGQTVTLQNANFIAFELGGM